MTVILSIYEDAKHQRNAKRARATSPEQNDGRTTPQAKNNMTTTEDYQANSCNIMAQSRDELTTGDLPHTSEDGSGAAAV